MVEFEFQIFFIQNKTRKRFSVSSSFDIESRIRVIGGHSSKHVREEEECKIRTILKGFLGGPFKFVIFFVHFSPLPSCFIF